MIMYSLMVIAPMNVISPVTAVLAAMVPVVFGVTVGERPRLYSWFGIVVGWQRSCWSAVPATSTRTAGSRRAPSALAFVAGLGFGFYFIFLARAGTTPGCGRW